MLTNIFDTHAHYDDEDFDADRFETLDEVFRNGVCGVINCGCTVASSKASLALAHRIDGVYAAVGIHPQNASEETQASFDVIRQLSQDEKAVAIGEIGLDYHYDYTPKEMQLDFFEKQLILANELDLPVIVHDREAHEDCVNLIMKHKPRGVMHCFSGSLETAKQLIGIGFYIGLGGSVTFKNARKPAEVAAGIDLDRILLETDCPYMAPVPLRGRRNRSDYIAYVAERIAALRGIDPQAVVDAARDNTKRLFGV
ncbi:MAG: TatD family hydrolase [Clostridia bacterium]|nr:TatD family hydrolase [Clostridia bacterium]